jgi:hypothetical protein
MKISSYTLIGVFLLGLAYSSTAEATPKTKSIPSLPFEQYFASLRGDQDVLKFNDFSGKIKAQRIKKLLRSGPVLGDRVLLQNNTAVYFPEGYIVSATAQFEKWRPKTGLTIDHVSSARDIEINPDYRLVENIDSQLGRVCAELPSPTQTLQFRKTTDGMFSLVRKTKGRFDHLLGEQSETVVITSALNPSYLSNDKRLQEMASRCI